MSSYHEAVLLDEAVQALCIEPNHVVVDTTFGAGGHSRAILDTLQGGTLIAFDRDADAANNLIDDGRLILIRENYGHLKRFLRLHGVTEIDSLLCDCGVSSHQLNVGERGFSTRFDGPLDMRMDKRQELHAGGIVNDYSEQDLASLFWRLGELRNSRAIAALIAQDRQRSPIRTTAQLMGLLEPEVKGLRSKFFAKVFQALRIEVNQELQGIKDLLTQSVEVLKPGGRLVFITYHSLEDRLVKNFFRSGNFEGKVKKDLYGNAESPLKIINRRVIVPGPEEIKRNSRARSAKMRIAEKR